MVDQTEDTITIEGDLYNTIEWVADGKVIATGNTIDLNDYEGKIHSYVRAQLKGDEGISFTQPFGVAAVNAGSARIDADKELAVVENGDTVTCTVSMKGLTGLNSFDVAVSYDSDIFEMAEVKSLLDNTVIAADKSAEGTARMIIGTSAAVSGDADVLQVVLKLKEKAAPGSTKLAIKSINTSATNGEGTFEGPVAIAVGEDTVEIISYRAASDINGDGLVTLADLSIALSKYQSTDASCDIDRSGTVDTADFIILTGFIA